MELAAQRVEQLGRRGEIAHLHVAVGAQLEEALQAGARVLRALPLVAVRQQQHQPRHALPLRFAAGEELVDDHLGHVGEVAELGLPDHQRLRIRGAVAVFEAQGGHLAERRVDDLEATLLRRQVLEGHVAPPVLGVEQHGVAVGERSAPGVLAAEPHAVTLQEQRAQRQRFAHAPVDAVLGHHLPSLGEQRRDLAVRVEALRQPGDGLGEPRHGLLRHRRGGAPVLAGPLQSAPRAAQRRRAVARRRVAAGEFVGGAQALVDRRLDRFQPWPVDDAFGHQLLRVTA